MVPRSAIDDGFGHWLAGFIDGEGCFVISPHGRPRSTYERFKPAFVIKLRDDDEAILLEIAQRTGIGVVHLLGPRKSATLNERPQAAWHVVRKEDCVQLVALLDRFPLRAKKARDFAIWREAVAEWCRIGGRGGPRRDWTRMAELKAQMEAARRYDGRAITLADAALSVVSDQLVLEEAV